jgi:hypothetical protein
MLSYQAWRRAVVDTGIHARAGRAQAQAYLHANTALSAHEIETEVDRYISWPGQALSYYLGEMSIIDGRRKAETALGERFDIRAFHDMVLQMGPCRCPCWSGASTASSPTAARVLPGGAVIGVARRAASAPGGALRAAQALQL